MSSFNPVIFINVEVSELLIMVKDEKNASSANLKCKKNQSSTHHHYMQSLSIRNSPLKLLNVWQDKYQCKKQVQLLRKYIFWLRIGASDSKSDLAVSTLWNYDTIIQDLFKNRL